LPGGHLRTGLELVNMLAQRRGQQEPDGVGIAFFRKRDDDSPGVGLVSKLHVELAAPHRLAVGGWG